VARLDSQPHTPQRTRGRVMFSPPHLSGLMAHSPPNPRPGKLSRSTAPSRPRETEETDWGLVFIHVLRAASELRLHEPRAGRQSNWGDPCWQTDQATPDHPTHSSPRKVRQSHGRANPNPTLGHEKKGQKVGMGSNRRSCGQGGNQGHQQCGRGTHGQRRRLDPTMGCGSVHRRQRHMVMRRGRKERGKWA